MTQRRKLDKINEPDYGIEKKAAKIAFDGKQYLIRIPKEIAELKAIKKGDLFEFSMEIPPDPKSIESGKLTIVYVRKDGKI